MADDKFIDLESAATMLGVSPEDLVAMRTRGEIFGYRNGASWKFKREEVQRVLSERSSSVRGDSAILSANDEDFENLISGLSSKILAEKAQEESESILVSEEELGVSATGQSTIIGKSKSAASPEDSDIKLALDDDLAGGSDKLLEAPGSRLNLANDGGDVLTGSDIQSSGSGTGDMPLAKPTSSGLDLGDNLSLGEDEDLELGSSDSVLDEEIRPGRTGSATGSGIGSDITMGAGDSGINLAPTDSGLSLDEEPLDLGGSGIESLELPEDDEIISLESDAADPDQATQLKADNEFLLSPGEGMIDDESDSGSQVIALEDSEAFDQDAATMLRSDEGALAADAFQPVGGDAGMPGMAPGMAGTQPVYVQVPVTETPYSVWNVLSLGLVALMLMITGMLMVDVMLNMWSWNGTSTVSTQVMDAFISMFGFSS